MNTKEENISDALGTTYAYFDCELLLLLLLIFHNKKSC